MACFPAFRPSLGAARCPSRPRTGTEPAGRDICRENKGQPLRRTRPDGGIRHGHVLALRRGSRKPYLRQVMPETPARAGNRSKSTAPGRPSRQKKGQVAGADLIPAGLRRKSAPPSRRKWAAVRVRRIQVLFSPARDQNGAVAARKHGGCWFSRKIRRHPCSAARGRNRVARLFSVARGWILSAPTPPPVVCPMGRGAAMVARRVAVPFCGRLTCLNISPRNRNTAKIRHELGRN